MRETQGIDYITIFIYILLVSIGLASVYSATSELGSFTLFDGRMGKQLSFFWVSIIASFIILIVNNRVFEIFAWHFYIAVILLLIAVLIFGTEIAGNKSWIKIGSLSIQPSEFAKYSTSLALAAVMSTVDFKLAKRLDLFKVIAVLFIPFAFILLQKDTGSALVFFSFLLVLYREGLSPIIFILGFAAITIFILVMIFGFIPIVITLLVLAFFFFIFFYTQKKLIIIGLLTLSASIAYSWSVEFIFNNILKQHQRDRILVTLNLLEDNQGVGYNVNQSIIAIGSGGFQGKGFLHGSHTKGNFIPEQATDFIFCTVGEEGGWIFSSITVLLFVFLIIRLLILAERARHPFKRIYIYAVMSIFFFHFVINIGMVIGLVPVIGIPLPFISYGGSSLLVFHILLFTAIKLDSSRKQDLNNFY
jgi:rod shape determining protein RodA